MNCGGALLAADRFKRLVNNNIGGCAKKNPIIRSLRKPPLTKCGVASCKLLIQS